MSDNFSFTNRDGFKSNLERIPYEKAYGADLSHFFKPYTTNILKASGTPAYESSVIDIFGRSLRPTGQWWATPSGLNPFGPNTQYEGIIHGTGLGSNMEIDINPDNVRTFGFKTPMTMVGWGFDQFGYPAPNYVSGYATSGLLQAAAPSSGFLGSGNLPVFHGKSVPTNNYLAGPIDLRFDIHKKVWTTPQSVFSAKITMAYFVSGGGILASGTAMPSSYFAGYMKYDARITDGYANQMLLTGITLSGPQPTNTSYQVKPLQSGTTVLIVHEPGPAYGLLSWHNPATTDCNNTPESFTSQSESGGIGSIEGSNEVLTGDALFTALGQDPLPVMYGGCGISGISQGEILIGREVLGTGYFGQYLLTAGTGIGITVDLSYPTGLVTFSLGTGISISTNGVNSDITELAGLTTPLTIAQGGTGQSVKSFVDLTTAQSVGGVKCFYSGIRVGTGTTISPKYSFCDYPTYGWSLNSGIAGFTLDTSHSGTVKISTSPTGTWFHDNLYVFNNNSISIDCPLKIRAPSTWGYVDTSGNFILNSTNLTEWYNSSGVLISYISDTGRFYLNKTTFVSQATSGRTINFQDGDGTVAFLSDVGAGGSPGGNNTSIQYNLSGSFAGSDNLTWASGNNKLYINGQVGIKVPNSSALLHIGSGTDTVPPLQFTSGTLVLLANDGMMEYDGRRPLFVPNGTIGRCQIATLGSYSSLNLVSDQTNLVIPEGTNVLRLSSVGQIVVHGLSLAYADGATINIVNVGNKPILFNHLSPNTTPSNRIYTPLELPMVLRPGDSWFLTYDSTNAYWILSAGYNGLLLDGRYCNNYQEHFLANHANLYTVATAGGGTAATNATTGYISNLGTLRLQITSGSTSRAALRSYNTMFLGQNFVFETEVRFDILGNTGNQYRFAAGLVTTAATDVVPNEAITFVYNSASGTSWIIRTADNAVAMNVSGVVTVQNHNHLKCVYQKFNNGSGIINYYINGTGVASHSGNLNIPLNTRSMQWGLIFNKTTGATTRNAYVDYIKITSLATGVKY